MWNNRFKEIKDIWDAPLFKSGSDAVQLSQIVIAIIVIVIGVAVSKFIIHLLKKRLMQHGHIQSSTLFFVQRLAFYILLIIVTLIGLSIAGIPITIFTVIGGALAIGVGFGAQNLINNLISSFIIMFEQPIRIGDIVEVDSNEGRIEHIGARRVRIRRVDGIDVLVPNSFFLEHNVVNWTLFDRQVRGTVTVGIAYGSDTAKASRILRDVADDNDRVLDTPEPVVLFNDFGDSSLVFQLLFWAQVSRPMDLRTLKSELRYAIDNRFREHGITIAFPQRDVHLDSLSPLTLRMERDTDRTKNKDGEENGNAGEEEQGETD